MAVNKQSIDDEFNNPDKVGTRYSVSKSHPAFGIDDNIANEYGHTRYPKYVEHPTEEETYTVTQSVGRDNFVHHQHKRKKQVIVNNKAEEDALQGKKKEEVKKVGWDNK